MPKRSMICLVVTLVAGALAADALACRTPVYRYAMFNWPVSPYYVFYLHRGEAPPDDKALHAKLEAMSRGEGGPPVNVTLVTVDASDEKEIEKLPKEVVEAWREADDGKTPVHLVYSSVGAKLYVGRLDADALGALVDSPARKRLGELFTAGKGIVWIVLEGSDAQANTAAKKTLEGILEECRTGKLSSPADESDLDSPAEGQAEDAAERKVHPSDMISVGMLTLSRGDKAETWFVRSLLALPPALVDEAEGKDDGAEKAKEQESYPANVPLVFAVYGRGRAMEPFAGKHITRDNLADCLLFLAGPCSCMIKAENPGCDLLVRWDWDETATAVQAKLDEQVAAEENAEPSVPVGAQPVSSGKSETKPGNEPQPATVAQSESNAAATPVEMVSKAVAAEDQPDFARRQSSQFVIILLAGGGVVFLLGALVWYWRLS